MYLIRCLAFIMAKFQFGLCASQIQGILADALLGYFHTHAPTGQSTFYTNSTDLTLILSKPDWTSGPDLWSAIFAVG